MRHVHAARAERAAMLLFVLVGAGLFLAGLVNLAVKIWRAL